MPNETPYRSERDMLDNAIRLLRDLGFYRDNPDHPIWKAFNSLPIDGPGVIIDSGFHRFSNASDLRSGPLQLLHDRERNDPCPRRRTGRPSADQRGRV